MEEGWNTGRGGKNKAVSGVGEGRMGQKWGGGGQIRSRKGWVPW